MASKGTGGLTGRADPTLVAAATRAGMADTPPDLSTQYGDLAKVWGGFFENTAKMNKALRDKRDLINKNLDEIFEDWDELAANLKNENEFEELNKLIAEQRQKFINNNGFANNPEGLNKWNRKNMQRLQALEIVDEGINAYQTVIKSGEFTEHGQTTAELAMTNNIIKYHKNENGASGRANASFQKNITEWSWGDEDKKENKFHIIPLKGRSPLQTENPDRYKQLLGKFYDKEVNAGKIKNGDVIRFQDGNGDYAYISKIDNEYKIRRAKDYKKHIKLKDHEVQSSFVELYNNNINTAGSEGFNWNANYGGTLWTNIYSQMANSADPQLAHQTLITSNTLPGSNNTSSWVDKMSNPSIDNFTPEVFTVLNELIKNNGLGDMLEQIGNKNSTLEIEDIFTNGNLSKDYKTFFSAITNPDDENYQNGGWKIGAGLFAQTQVNSFKVDAENAQATTTGDSDEWKTKFNQTQVDLNNLKKEFDKYKIQNPEVKTTTWDTTTQDGTYDWQADLGISFALTGEEIDDLATNIENRNDITINNNTYTWDGNSYVAPNNEKVKNLESLLLTIDEGAGTLTNFSQFDNITDWTAGTPPPPPPTNVTKSATSALRDKFDNKSETSVTAFLEELKSTYTLPSGIEVVQDNMGNWGLRYNGKDYMFLNQWSNAAATGLRAFLKTAGIDVGRQM